MPEPRPGAARVSRAEVAVSLAAATLVMTAIAWPWLRSASHVLPHAPPSGGAISEWARGALWADSALVVWILAWVPHALWSNPLGLLDANVLHPTPQSLLGSETLLSFALVSGPIYAATGNAVLAANVTTFLTFVLAGWLFYLVLRREGLHPLACAIAAAAFAFGPMRIPPRVHIVQFSNLVLPLLALAFTARRRTPLVFLAALVGFLSSAYLAAMVGVLAAVEIAFSLRREGLARTAGPATAVALAALPFLALGLAYASYTRDAVGGGASELHPSVGLLMQSRLLNDLSDPESIGWLLTALAGIGLVLRRPAGPALGRAGWATVAALGLILASGPELRVAEWTIPLPMALLRDTPFDALRSYNRFVILAQMGIAALAALGMDGILARSTKRASRKLRVAAQASLGLVLLIGVTHPRPLALHHTELVEVPVYLPRHGFYPLLRSLPRGPLLEIPGPTRKEDLPNEARQGDAMIASTIHWLPIVNGHTRFLPWWYPDLAAMISRVRSPQNLRGVVEMTGLRWILVHGDEIPADEYRKWQRLARRGTLFKIAFERNRHLLLEVRQRPRTTWRQALLQGAAEGRSALGTRLEPLAEAAAKATVTTSRTTHRVPPGGRIQFQASVRNLSAKIWPTLLPPGSKEDGLVVLESRWRAPDGDEIGDVRRTRLGRDVLPWETVSAKIELEAPATPGTYELVVNLRQVGGARFAATEPLVVEVEVEVEEGPLGG